MTYLVYILLSKTHNRTYVGQTQDLASRVARHNSGRVRSTKAFVPWRVIHFECYTSRGEAVKREAWYKTVSGRKQIAVLISKAETIGLSDHAKRDRDLVVPEAPRTKPP